MSGEGGRYGWMWVAIVLLAALFFAGAVVGVYWVAMNGSPMGERVARALAAGGATFLGLAGLGLAIGGYLRS